MIAIAGGMGMQRLSAAAVVADVAMASDIASS